MLFIPFLDGLVDFDCAPCGGRCCQGGFIAASDHERAILLQEHPTIRFFSTGEENALFRYRKYPACWFLQGDGRCEIHGKHGYGAKPFVCRLHPFYVARCAADHVVVPSGCDRLRAIRRGTPTHVLVESVRTNAEESIGRGFFLEELGWSSGRVALERAIVNDSVRFLADEDYLGFASSQLAATVPGTSVDQAREELDDVRRAWMTALGVDDLETRHPAVSYELIALTSILRAGHRGLRSLDTSRIPVALLALHLYMVLYSQGRDVERRLATYRAVLDDVPLGLAHAGRAALKLKDLPLEKRLEHLRLLRKVHEPGCLERMNQLEERTK
jgi:Fe-S-cluster containining protein